VTDGHRVRVGLDHPVNDVKIRPANSSSVNAYDNFIGARLGYGDVFYPNGEIFEDPGRSHQLSRFLSFGRARSARTVS
jgi:hypothetical protein